MSLEVRCRREPDGFSCEVAVSEAGSSTHHRVRVRTPDFDRWARGRSAEQLVRDAFEFLLKRESKESILREFDLSVIKRYFPDFEK